MNLETLLSKEKSAIRDRWIDRVIDAYPPETARLLRKERDQFANPVGYSIRQGLGDLLDEFLQGNDPEKLSPPLDLIIRIRAVQDFTPAQATGFVFFLKKIVREIAASRPETAKAVTADEFAGFDAKVDELALIAFNVYARCREMVYEIRVGELKDKTFRLLQKSDLLGEISEWFPQKKKDGNT